MVFMSQRSDRFRVPESELSWRFSRASGPGGQHVNTSDTRVELSWSIGESDALTPEQKERVRSTLGQRLNGGVLTIVGARYRSQHRNREDARVRLETVVTQALVMPRKRRPTRPTRGANERRLDAKRQRSQVKRMRRSPD